MSDPHSSQTTEAERDEAAVRTYLSAALMGLAFGIKPDRPALVAAHNRIQAMIERGKAHVSERETTDPVRLALDALWADLPYLMGRASAEGHEAGQALAQQWRAKIDAAIKEAADDKR